MTFPSALYISVTRGFIMGAHRVGAIAEVGLGTVLLMSLLAVGVPMTAVAQVITTEEERAREAERSRQVRERDAGQVEPERRYDRHRPSELYVAGFGGYTFGHGINDVEGTGLASGNDFGNIGLKNSGV